MIYLLLTILLNTVVFSLFKLFPKFNINQLQAIVANYIVCVITGSIFIGQFPINSSSASQPWFPWAALMGCMFIGIFNFIAWSTMSVGMTTTTIANKLSLVIPVGFSVYLYQEHISTLNIVGILLAVPAVYFTSKNNDEKRSNNNLLFPFLLFILSGLLDTLVKYVEQSFLKTPVQQAGFTIHTFAIAASIGAIIVFILLVSRKMKFSPRSIIAGIILGVPNYFSIYFLIRLLNSQVMQSAIAIPVNNIGILVCSTVVAVFFFKEKLNTIRIVGLGLALIAIALIAFNS